MTEAVTIAPNRQKCVVNSHSAELKPNHRCILTYAFSLLHFNDASDIMFPDFLLYAAYYTF